MAFNLAQAADWLLPSLPSQEHIRARFVALVGLIAATTGLVTGLFIYAVGDPSAIVTLSYAGLAALTLVALRLGARPGAVFWSLQFLTALVFIGSRLVEAELDWPLVTWLCIFPVLGVLFGGLRPGVGGLCVAALTGAAFWYLEFHPPFPGVPLLRTISAVRACALVLALFALALAFDAMRKQALRQVEDAARARTLFLANMSHELRTPINGVIGITELLLDRPLDADVHSQLELLRRSGTQVVTLVNDILDLTRLESGHVELESVPMDVRAIVTDVVGLLKPPAEQKGLALSSEVAAEVPPFMLGDPTRLRQIITNLLANAVKFTHGGSVTLRASRGGPKLRFEIQDTGIGISPEVQGRLFRPFEQADVSYTRRYGGSGLGLTISQHLVMQMKGAIELRSAEGVGSTFSFELDCVPCAAPALAQKKAAAPGASHQPMHVLVVEDNAVNLHVVVAMLTRCGCTMVTAHDGNEALAAVGREPFDLILMDCHMPNLDGFEATRKLRAMPGPVGQTRVVALTASVLAEELEHCRAVGMNDVLTKPLSLDALQVMLARTQDGR